MNIAAPKRENFFIIAILAVIIAVIILVSFLFSTLVNNYKKNIAYESADHLAEINSQIKLYIEEKIENDWRTAYSIENGLTSREFNYENIISFINRARDIWHVSNVLVCNEQGYCVDTQGAASRNDVASDIVYNARLYGEYMSIVNSTITYTIPVDSKAELDGSPIAAVSIVQEISSFLDNMNISAFDGTACLYLTRENGVVISRLTNPSATDTFNIATYLKVKELVSLTEGGNSVEDIFSSQEPVVHLINDPQGNKYVASAPIKTRGENIRLFYIVPEKIVNRTMDGFSEYMTGLSLFIIISFSLLAILAFLYIYRARKRRFDKDLATREKLFNLLVANTRTAFALFSLKSKEPVYISSNAERIIGESYMLLEKTDEGFSMRNKEGVRTESLEQINEQLSAYNGKGEFISGFIRNEAATPPSYYVIHLYPVEGDGDEFVGIAQDVTTTREREEAVKSALILADDANAAKTRFLSNMSHDIRTPMNAIVNMTDFAIESLGEPVKQMEYLSTIRESSKHLLHLINDILDMSRIESGRTSVAAESFGLRAMLAEVCDMLCPLYEARAQRFIADFSAIRNDNVRGDRLKLSQVLINLLNNAVKFTPAGGEIKFSVVQAESLRQGMGSYCFTVKDNGIGIAKEDIERMFEPFSRVDDKRVGGVEGTGLGLSICKSFVNAMGGTLSCKSEANVGSEFTVELFMELTENERVEHLASVRDERFDGRCALLVEDNAVNQAIARKLLERIGFMVDVACDGGEGASKFLSSKPGYYDVVFMDIQMPILDGYQATAKIRSGAHAQSGTIPIVAMTANVFAEDVERSRAAGMNGHIGKPIMLNELMAETNRVLSLEGRL